MGNFNLRSGFRIYQKYTKLNVRILTIFKIICPMIFFQCTKQMHLLAKSNAVSVKIVKAAFPFLWFCSYVRLVSPLLIVVVYCVFFVVLAVLSQ